MIVAYVLCNRFGEVLMIPRELERVVAEELIEQGWELYRAVYA